MAIATLFILFFSRNGGIASYPGPFLRDAEYGDFGGNRPGDSPCCPRGESIKRQLIASSYMNIMGYRAVCVEGEPKAGLTCIHCKDLLRSPVQTEEGHRLCKTCFYAIKM